MKFLMRDDDTCALTRVEELQKCYHAILEEIPICLSVTPFRIPGPSFDVSPENRDKPFALERNKDLLLFLREGIVKGCLDIAMHGYYHAITSPGQREPLPDYGRIGKRWWREYLYGDNLEEKTRDGKRYLESILGYEINTFVPPGNAISKQGLKALINHKFNLIGISGIMLNYEVTPLNPFNYLNAAKRRFWKMKHRNFPKYPFVLDFKTHKEITYYLLYPSTDLNELKKEIDFVHSVNGILILSTHYHAFPKKIKSGQTIEYAFRVIMDHVGSKDNINFITYRELWK